MERPFDASALKLDMSHDCSAADMPGFGRSDNFKASSSGMCWAPHLQTLEDVDEGSNQAGGRPNIRIRISDRGHNTWHLRIGKHRKNRCSSESELCEAESGTRLLRRSPSVDTRMQSLLDKRLGQQDRSELARGMRCFARWAVEARIRTRTHASGCVLGGSQAQLSELVGTPWIRFLDGAKPTQKVDT